MTPCYSHLSPFCFFHLTLYSAVHSTEEGRHILHSFVAATKHSIKCISNPFPLDEHLHHFQSFALTIIASIIVLQKPASFLLFLSECAFVKLKCSWFTMLCCFQVYGKVIQLYLHKYAFFSDSFPLWVIIQYWI